jgi:hypothetical protein
MLAVLALAKEHGPAIVDETAKRRSTSACRRTAFSLGISNAACQCRQVGPFIRQLTLYRDLIDRKTGDPA